MSLLVFAGAAQLSAITMVTAGAPSGAILGSTMIISARHLLYSMVFRKHAEQLSLPKRLMLAFVLTDEMFVVSEAHTKQTGIFSVNFALISGFSFYVVWNVATYIGVVFGQRLQNLNELGLDFAIVATFIVMSVEQIQSRPELVTVLLSGIAAVVLKPVFSESYIVIATLIGMCGGYMAGASREKNNDVYEN